VTSCRYEWEQSLDEVLVFIKTPMGVCIYIYMHSRTCFPFSLRLSEIQDVYVSMIVPQVKASLLNVIIETQRGDVFDSMSR
jgi:hypothetical protein